MAGSIITFSGKGGSGKTTTASLVLRELVRSGHGPILAVDADPNATLGLTLGADVPGTIADLRENMDKAAKDPGEISKDRLMDQWLNELLSEQDGYDLLTMGRPEGPKCYCYVNGLLRRYLSLLRKSYAYVLVDCEAGMEYLSRLVVDDIETIVFVAEPTPVGLTTARRISRLADELPIRVRRRVLAVNKVSRPLASAPAEEDYRVQHILQIPYDNDVADRCSRGEAIDADAGRESRPAIEQLARHAIGAVPQSVA